MDYTQEPHSDPRQGYHFFRFGSSRRFPSGLKWLILINVVVFFLELVLLLSGERRFAVVFGPLGLDPADVFGRGYVWQLLTYSFLHSPVNIWHIIFNMLFLYWFGREIEQAWGTRRFVTFYLTAAVFSGLIFSLVHVFREVTWCIGASGAVMAALMVYALYWPNRIILLMFIIPMRIRTFVIFVIAFEILSLLQMNNGVANMAHLGGLLYGYLIVRLGPRLAAFFDDFVHGRDDHSTNEDQRRLDEILDKVNRRGMNSLSWGERRFLQKMSKKR